MNMKKSATFRITLIITIQLTERSAYQTNQATDRRKAEISKPNGDGKGGKVKGLKHTQALNHRLHSC